MAEDDGFLSRWSRRKVQVQQGLPVPPAPQTEPVPATATATAPALRTPSPAEAVANEPEAPPLPTLEEAQRLTPADDFSRFVGRGVDPQVKNTALKTLFSDPHFNVMDGLDTYIDDYNTPDPLPAGMLQKMTQSAMLRLFEVDPDPQAQPEAEAPQPLVSATTPPELPPLHEDPDLRLQPNDDAGLAGDQPGPVEDPGRQL